MNNEFQAQNLDAAKPQTVQAASSVL